MDRSRHPLGNEATPILTNCHYCGRPVCNTRYAVWLGNEDDEYRWTPPGTAWLEWDHKTPRRWGGTDDRANIVPSCRPCNRAKRDRPYLDFLLDPEGPAFFREHVWYRPSHGLRFVERIARQRARARRRERAA